MDSINEQFHQVYNAQYNLAPYEAKKTPFSQEELLTYSKEQHELLSTINTATTTTTATTATKDIVIFLVREISDVILKRYELVAKNLTQPVYLITDKFYPKHEERGLKILYFYENFCYDAGYFYVNTDVMPDKVVITWDRCLFFLANYKGLYERAWIIEDDVAIHGKDTLSRFFEKYENTSADILSSPPLINKKDPFEWPLWLCMRNSGLTPLWAAYNPVARLSRRFIEAVEKFAKEKKRLFFLEIFFTSLAIKEGLKTEYFHDLETHFRYTPNITFEETQEKSIVFPIFHPVKDLELWDKIWFSGAI